VTKTKTKLKEELFPWVFHLKRTKQHFYLSFFAVELIARFRYLALLSILISEVALTNTYHYAIPTIISKLPARSLNFPLIFAWPSVCGFDLAFGAVLLLFSRL